MIADFFKTLFNVIWGAIKWIGEFIRDLFQFLIDIIVGFFEIIYAIIDGIFYFIYKCGVLLAELFRLFLKLGQMVWSLVVGFGKTLASLNYSPRGSSGTAYSDMLGKLFSNLSFLQLDPIAYILLFIIWFFTAITALKLLSSIRIGGE